MAEEVKVLAAFDEKEMGSVPLVSMNEMESYLAEAHQLHEERRHLPIPQRIEILEKTIQIVKGRFEEIV